MAEQFDVVILGTGNAGMAAAGVVREAGRSVAMVESRDVGGTCPIRGCVPKKVLVAAAQVLHQIELAPQHHIKVGKPELDWGALIARERTFVDGVPDMFRSSMENRGITLFEGAARFTGRQTLDVAGTPLTAETVVIATGSKPRTLPIDGAEHMINSDDILEMTDMPESLVFIGGGVIALEFSHVYARAGCQVTILEVLPRLLPRMDAGAVEQIHRESERIGITIQTGVRVNAVVRGSGDLTVKYSQGDAEKTVTATRVANGAGRVPDLDTLDLDTAGVEHDGPRISVDKQMRSVSNPAVFVAGDALATAPQLSPVASYEGRIVGRNILGEALEADYSWMPANVYTVPAVASVGLTEEEAEQSGRKFAVKTNEMTGWRSAKTHAESVAYAKVIVEDETGHILGAHMVGHGAEEVIHIFSLAMKHGLTRDDLVSGVYAYPTFTSDLKFLV